MNEADPQQQEAAWEARVEQQLGAAPERADDGWLLSRSSGGQIRLPTHPSGDPLTIDITADGQAHLILDGPPSRSIAIRSTSLSKLTAQIVSGSDPSGPLLIDRTGQDASLSVQLGTEWPTTLELRGGRFSLDSRAPEDLRLVDSSYVGKDTDRKLRRVRLGGSVTWGDSSRKISVNELSMAPGTVVNLRGPVEVTGEPGATSGHLDFSLGSTDERARLIVTSLPAGATVAGVSINPHTPGVLALTGDVHDLTIRGPLRLEVHGHILVRARFVEDQGLPSLHLSDAGVYEASGALGFLEGQRLFQGDGSIRIHRLGELTDAEVEGFQPYDLGDHDLPKAVGSHRFWPSFEPTAQERRRAELGMQHGEAENTSLRRKRAVRFWTLLARILAEQDAPSELQSSAHLAAMRARRREARALRERFWLGAYSLVGYGERVLLPLGWYALVALLATWGLMGLGAGEGITADTQWEFWKLTGTVAIAPLSYFRLREGDVHDLGGPWDDALWTAVTVAEVVLAFFALLAIRRVVRVRSLPS